MEFHGVEQMRWLPFIINIALIMHALILRTLIHCQVDVFTIREFSARFTWLAILIFIVSGVIGVLLRRLGNMAASTIITSVVGILLWCLWYGKFITI